LPAPAAAEEVLLYVGDPDQADARIDPPLKTHNLAPFLRRSRRVWRASTESTWGTGIAMRTVFWLDTGAIPSSESQYAQRRSTNSSTLSLSQRLSSSGS